MGEGGGLEEEGEEEDEEEGGSCQIEPIKRRNRNEMPPSLKAHIPLSSNVLVYG